MKKNPIILSFLFISMLMISGLAYAHLSDRQIVQGYYNCLKFLKMSKAKQTQVASHTTASRLRLVQACTYLSKRSVKQVLRENHEYDRWERNRSSSDDDDSSESSNPSCSSTIQCTSGAQCIGHECKSIPGGCDNGPNSCTPGETCTDGKCH